jgi:hypothetical protein
MLVGSQRTVCCRPALSMFLPPLLLHIFMSQLCDRFTSSVLKARLVIPLVPQHSQSCTLGDPSVMCLWWPLNRSSLPKMQPQRLVLRYTLFRVRSWERGRLRSCRFCSRKTCSPLPKLEREVHESSHARADGRKIATPKKQGRVMFNLNHRGIPGQCS